MTLLVMLLQVTLHNTALFNMDSDPTGGFRKLSHLLQSPPFPPQTFCNILMLYCKPQHAFYDLAADVMAENADLVATSLSKVAWLPKTIFAPICLKAPPPAQTTACPAVSLCTQTAAAIP